MNEIIFSELPKDSPPPVCEKHDAEMEYDEELGLWFCPDCAEEFGKAAEK